MDADLTPSPTATDPEGGGGLKAWLTPATLIGFGSFALVAVIATAWASSRRGEAALAAATRQRLAPRNPATGRSREE